MPLLTQAAVPILVPDLWSMSAMLNAMQQLMTGGNAFFDPDFLQDLAHCWNSTHPNLTRANDNAWKGLMDFYENDGYGNDPWDELYNKVRT